MDIKELVQSVDIVDYIGQYTDFEERNGEFWCSSLFKPENTPSFSVRRETGDFYDFSSGKSGGVLQFIMAYDRCSFREAVEKLKKYAGVDGELVQTKRLASTSVAKRFKRKKAPAKSTKAQSLAPGYMDRFDRNLDKMQIWIEEGISMETLDKFGVKYDPFQDRLVYPIRDIVGDLVNVGGRVLTPGWKEAGMRKYTYYHGWPPGGMNIIYGLYENIYTIMEKRTVILFEGVKSVMMAATWGVQNTGCLMTSHCSGNQLKVLLKLGVKVVFALDKEVKVWEDANIQKLKNYTNVYYYVDKNDLLDDKDSPVDKGFDVFKTLMSDLRMLK